MKCVKHIETGKIMRVSDKIANKHVYLGGWIFIPKQEWKDKVRDKHKTNNNEGVNNA